MAALHHLDLIKLVLQSYGGAGNDRPNPAVLVPDVIRDDWKKWWEWPNAELKKTAIFLCRARPKKTEPYYQAKMVACRTACWPIFPGSKDSSAAHRRHEALKNFPDLKTKSLGKEILGS